MFKRNELIFLILTFFNSNLVQTAKYWNVNNDRRLEFNDKNNWESGNLPCSRDKIVFPKEYQSVLITPTDLQINGIIFPVNGAMIFGGEKSTISLGLDQSQTKKQTCLNKDYFAKIKTYPHQDKYYWFDPNNWSTKKGIREKSNPAKVHIERIPCSNEIAYMDYKKVGQIIVDMENIDKLELGGFNMGGTKVSSDSFEQGLFTKLAHLIFKNGDDIQVRYLHENSCGCHRNELVNSYQPRVCKHVHYECVKNYPKCIHPIRPSGHCCDICGSMVKIMIDDCRHFNMPHFKDLIEKSISEQGMTNELDFDATIINDINSQYVQLVVLDRDEYQEQSVEFMQTFNKSILKNGYFQFDKTFYTSGMPYDKEKAGFQWSFIFLPLLGVIIFFFIVFVNFIPENPYISIPSWLYSGRYNIFNSPFVFARFDNQSENATGNDEFSGGTVSVEMKMDYTKGIGSFEQENIDQGGISFDNPMFQDQDSEVIKDFGTLNDTELTEIHLPTKVKD